MVIYNRWGEVVFESFDSGKGWNGTYGGDIVPDGVYLWQITTADIATDEKRDFYGHVTVIK
jgi:gliding motility-associated-like protein